MTIIIRGAAQSTCTQRILVVLKELNVPYEIQPVDFSVGEHKSPAYLEHQPFGQIPYIVSV
jgi:glutathione S-transferase